jgi:hypothetical protein
MLPYLICDSIIQYSCGGVLQMFTSTLGDSIEGTLRGSMVGRTITSHVPARASIPSSSVVPGGSQVPMQAGNRAARVVKSVSNIGVRAVNSSRGYSTVGSGEGEGSPHHSGRNDSTSAASTGAGAVGSAGGATRSGLFKIVSDEDDEDNEGHFT